MECCISNYSQNEISEIDDANKQDPSANRHMDQTNEYSELRSFQVLTDLQIERKFIGFQKVKAKLMKANLNA